MEGMNMRTRTSSTATWFALAFALVACGDDDVGPAPMDGGTLDGNTAVDLGDGGGGGASCTGAADGTACELPSGVAAICASGACVESTCGDTVVDPRTETCDDGNTEPGDGCEPTTCAFTCALDSECSDENDCNGIETCALALHRCQLGTMPAVGAACTTVGGIAGECNASVVCGPAGCGNGMPGAGEECDDGNDEDGDGCDNDCTFSCETAAECDDVSVCTGTESCDTTSHTCVAGTPLVCTDGNACTADECDATAGCEHPLIDADGDGQAASTLGGCGTDCDDTNAARYVGAEELCDAVDNDCDGMTDESAPTWYVDCDGDTFAASMVGAMSGCTMPSAAATGCPVGTARSWTSRRPIATSSTDCYDANANVKPGQSTYFSSAASGRPLSVDYDYNCSTTEDREYTDAMPIRIVPCVADPRSIGGCDGTYWRSATIPACGSTGELSLCAPDRTGTCARSTVAAHRQRCR
jgi:cysteine-rich repeat protein